MALFGEEIMKRGDWPEDANKVDPLAEFRDPEALESVALWLQQEPQSIDVTGVQDEEPVSVESAAGWLLRLVRELQK
jgi:hypothetical protein